MSVSHQRERVEERRDGFTVDALDTGDAQGGVREGLCPVRGDGSLSISVHRRGHPLKADELTSTN